MKKYKKAKCDICGNYSFTSYAEPFEDCPICGCEDAFDNDRNIINENIEYYKINGFVLNAQNFVRRPMGIELPGLYEPDNREAQNYPQLIYTKKCLSNKDKYYKLAESALYVFENTLAKNDVFEIFNALAYDDSIYGLYSAFNLAICYAIGYGYKQNLLGAFNILKDIRVYYGYELNRIGD